MSICNDGESHHTSFPKLFPFRPHSLSVASLESYNYRKLPPMSFASLINLCSQQSSLSRSFRKSSRSSYNPSVKWKSSGKKVSLHFSRTMPLICAHLLISSPSFTALSPALSLRARCESFPDLTFPKFLHSCFRRVTARQEGFFKCPKDHRFFCLLLSFLSVLSSSVAAFIRSVAILHLLSFLSVTPPPRVFAHGLVLSG